MRFDCFLNGFSFLYELADGTFRKDTNNFILTAGSCDIHKNATI